MDNKIKIKKILLIINRLLADMERDNPDGEIPIEKDFYWVVGIEDMFNVLDAPTNLHVGQLFEDVENLNKLKLNQLNIYDLIKVSAILNYLYLYQIDKNK